MIWCTQTLNHDYCPVFHVQVTTTECATCRNDDATMKITLTTRAIDTGVDIKRPIHTCKNASTVLQGVLDGCCKDAKTIPTLIMCEKLGKPVSTHTCYACGSFIST